MKDRSQLSIGDRVHYKPAHFSEAEWENGVVKELPKHDPQMARVVYHCDNRWEEFMNYTGALTRLIDIETGWRD